jgi:inhibitor of cysteine peptidase
MSEIVVSEAHNSGTVSVNVGDVVIIRLQENPTTGYRWQIDAAIGVTLTGDEFSGVSSAPGSGGERKLSFTAPASGTFHVQATLRRDWEQGVAPQARFAIAIQVR